MTKLLTLAEACERLGQKPTENAIQNLRRRLRRYEKRERRSILVGEAKGGRGGKRVAWVDVKKALRTFDARWELEKCDVLEERDFRCAAIADRRFGVNIVPVLRKIKKLESAVFLPDSDTEPVHEPDSQPVTTGPDRI